jgi:hypothetical protein
MRVGEIAIMAGCSHEAVTGACRRLGFKKVAIPGTNLTGYNLTQAQVKKILTEGLHYRPGRPKERKA